MRYSAYLLLIILVVCTSCRQREPVKTAANPVRVRLSSVGHAVMSIPVRSVGILSPGDEIKLSFKTGGIVSGINAEEGDVVEKGDLLASLDLTEINANVNQTRLAFEKAQRDYERAENLFRDSIGTLEQKQNLLTALNYAELAYKIARYNLAHSTITAPDNGVILKKLARNNELVSPGYPVLLFGSAGSHWKVRAGVADRDIVKIRAGDSASVSFDSYPGEKFSARVGQVGGMSNPVTGTFEAVLALDRTALRLVSGFIGSVEIFPSRRDTMTMVPVEAIVDADGHSANVYYVNGNSVARRARVEVITLSGDMAAVRGLPPGIEEVIAAGAAYVKDGVTVEVVK